MLGGSEFQGLKPRAPVVMAAGSWASLPICSKAWGKLATQSCFPSKELQILTFSVPRGSLRLNEALVLPALGSVTLEGREGPQLHLYGWPLATPTPTPNPCGSGCSDGESDIQESAPQG